MASRVRFFTRTLRGDVYAPDSASSLILVGHQGQRVRFFDCRDQKTSPKGWERMGCDGRWFELVINESSEEKMGYAIIGDLHMTPPVVQLGVARSEMKMTRGQRYERILRRVFHLATTSALSSSCRDDDRLREAGRVVQRRGARTPTRCGDSRPR